MEVFTASAVPDIPFRMTEPATMFSDGELLPEDWALDFNSRHFRRVKVALT